MKDVKYLCEDVHKTATILPINFHSQQCKLSTLLPSQSHQHRLGAVSRAMAVRTQQEKLTLNVTGTTLLTLILKGLFANRLQLNSSFLHQ